MATYNRSMLGQRIEAQLDELDQTQDWLAREVGVSQQTISKWINGTTSPRPRRLQALARALQMETSDLATLLANDEANAHVDAVGHQLLRTNEGLDNLANFAAGDGLVAALASPLGPELLDALGDLIARTAETQERMDQNPALRSIFAEQLDAQAAAVARILDALAAINEDDFVAAASGDQADARQAAKAPRRKRPAPPPNE